MNIKTVLAGILLAVSLVSDAAVSEGVITVERVRAIYHKASRDDKLLLDASSRAVVLGAMGGWFTQNSTEGDSYDPAVVACFVLMQSLNTEELLTFTDDVLVKVPSANSQDWRIVVGISVYMACVPYNQPSASGPAQKKKKLLKT